MSQSCNGISLVVLQSCQSCTCASPATASVLQQRQSCSRDSLAVAQSCQSCNCHMQSWDSTYKVAPEGPSGAALRVAAFRTTGGWANRVVHSVCGLRYSLAAADASGCGHIRPKRITAAPCCSGV